MLVRGRYIPRGLSRLSNSSPALEWSDEQNALIAPLHDDLDARSLTTHSLVPCVETKREPRDDISRFALPSG
jgi:hypothetical protein